MLDEKKDKRFFICYKKKVEEELEKEITVIDAVNEVQALLKFSEDKDVINQKIERNEQKEGWIYCNELYNPLYKNEEVDNGI